MYLKFLKISFNLLEIFWTHHFLPKNYPFPWIDPQTNYLPRPWIYSTYRPKTVDVRSAILPQCARQTDRQTDQQMVWGKVWYLGRCRPIQSFAWALPWSHCCLSIVKGKWCAYSLAEATVPSPPIISSFIKIQNNLHFWFRLENKPLNGCLFVWCHQIAKIDIDYAKVAKRIDVKRLKSTMWEVISEAISASAFSPASTNTVCFLPSSLHLIDWLIDWLIFNKHVTDVHAVMQTDSIKHRKI